MKLHNVALFTQYRRQVIESNTIEIWKSTHTSLLCNRSKTSVHEKLFGKGSNLIISNILHPIVEKFSNRQQDQIRRAKTLQCSTVNYTVASNWLVEQYKMKLKLTIKWKEYFITTVTLHITVLHNY